MSKKDIKAILEFILIAIGVLAFLYFVSSDKLDCLGNSNDTCFENSEP